MTIGLTVGQIRKLSKGGYTDKQLAKKADRGVRVSGESWWTNDYMVLFEGVPESAEVRECPAEKIVELAKEIGRMVSRCKHEVYPVEVQPWDNWRSKGESRKLIFESVANRVIVDAKCAATVLATKRVGRKHDPDVRWYTDFEGRTLLAVNGRRLGLICGLPDLPPAEPPAWNFRYTGELPN